MLSFNVNKPQRNQFATRICTLGNSFGNASESMRFLYCLHDRTIKTSEFLYNASASEEKKRIYLKDNMFMDK